MEVFFGKATLGLRVTLPRIQDPQRWGGGIELAILAAHYSTEPGRWVTQGARGLEG